MADKVNYAEMSDFEINMAVSKLTGTYRYIESNPEFSKHIGRNYCNSWADAGQIIESAEIGLVRVAGGWCATHDAATYEGVYFVNQKPLRAAMIVFLMMQEEK